jgi:hypothetical protein
MKKPVTHKRIAVLHLPKQISQLLGIARAIAHAMDTNKSFPTPDPPVAAINTAADDLDAAEAEVKGGAKNGIPTRDAKAATLVSLLEQERSYVQKVASADPANAEVLIQSAAMNVKRVPTHGPRVFGAKQGALSGSAELVTGSAGRRAAYDWEYSADGGKTWQAASSTLQAKIVLSGLQSGVNYAFRYRTLTKSGVSDWSVPTMLVVK